MIGMLSNFFNWAHYVCEVHHIADTVECIDDDLQGVLERERKRRQKRRLARQQSAQSLQSIIGSVAPLVGAYLGSKADKPAPPVRPAASARVEADGRQDQDGGDQATTMQRIASALSVQINEQFETMNDVMDKRIAVIEGRIAVLEGRVAAQSKEQVS